MQVYIAIIDDLMCVMDEHGDGYDAELLTTRDAAIARLDEWKEQYDFDMGDARQLLDNFFVDHDQPTKFFVATRTRYVLVDASDESQAREVGNAALYDLYEDLRAKLGRDVPIEIHTVRPATEDEIRLSAWHDMMVAREKSLGSK